MTKELNGDREVLEHIRTTRARQRFLPNDDRGALLRVMRQAGFAEHLHEDMREKVLQAWADEFVGEGIGLSRATVPDAATEPGYYQEGIEEGVKIGRSEAEAERDAANEYAFFARQTLAEVEEERDAALAAVERIRSRHRKTEASAVTGDCATEECEHEDECPTEMFEVCAACWNLCESADPYFGERGITPVLWPCEIATALDGAPEPEWEYGRLNSAGDVSLPDPDLERAQYRAGVTGQPVVRRRKAGPWLPVEGESKP